jgi:hypothetical protein
VRVQYDYSVVKLATKTTAAMALANARNSTPSGLAQTKSKLSRRTIGSYFAGVADNLHRPFPIAIETSSAVDRQGRMPSPSQAWLRRTEFTLKMFAALGDLIAPLPQSASLVLFKSV